MQIIIQKFGGTSIQTVENRNLIINHVKKKLNNNYKLVVVVSAMGRKPDPYATDTLLEIVNYPLNNNNSKREIDLLMSCGEIISSIVLSNELNKNDITATALTGDQAGLITDEHHNAAKVKKVNTGRIMKELETKDVVIVAGFQGQTETGEITTIGRGGSDTTAAHLGAALYAKRIEIFTDVNGIMTADPRVVKTARSLDFVTYTEICNMAYQGAQVIHPKAVEIAMRAHIPIRVRSTYSNDMGTLVTAMRPDFGEDVPQRMITGIAHIRNVTQIKVKIKEGERLLQSTVFKAMAEKGISVDFINISPSEIIFTVLGNTTMVAANRLNELGLTFEIKENCAKVSAVGAGMTGTPGVASRIVQSLTNHDVKILQSADSHTTIWVLIKGKDLHVAVNALHEEFELSSIKETILNYQHD